MHILILGFVFWICFRQCLFNNIVSSDSLKNFQLDLALNSHSIQFLTLSEDARYLFACHVLIDQFGKYLPIVNIHSANIFLIGRDLTQKVARDQKDNDYEENDEDLQLVVFFLQIPGKSNTDSETTLTVWIAILQEVLPRLLIRHDCVSLRNLNELVNCLWIVRVLIWMLLS